MRTKLILFVVWCLLISMSAGLKAQNMVDPDDPSSWMVNTAALANSMNIYAVIDVAGVESIDNNDVIGIFVAGTNEIRGVASPEFIVSQNRYIANIFVYSDEGMGDPDGLSILVYDASIDRVLPSTTFYTFLANDIIGSFSEPDTIETVKIDMAISKDDVLCEADTFGWASVDVSGTGQPPYTLAWSTGSDQDSIFHLAAGRYYLTVTDDNGFSEFDSVDIVNTNRPILAPTIAVAPADTVCEGQDVYLFAASLEVESPVYEWYNNFGDSLTTNPSWYEPDIATSKEFEVQTNVRNCRSPRTSFDVTVLPAPEADFTVSNTVDNTFDTIVFTPDSIELDWAYFWDFGDGNTASDVVAEHAYTREGSFLSSLVVTTSDGCTDRAVQYFDINEKDLDVDYTFDRPLCASDTTGFLFAQALNGTAPYEYLWNTGDTIQAIENLSPGVYGLTITDFDGNELITAFNLFPSQQALAVPRVEVNQGRSVCYGADIVMTAALDNPNVVFRWYTTIDGTEPLFTGDQLSVFNIEEDQTYFVEAVLGPCVSSERAQLDVVVTQLDATFDANIRDGNTSTIFTFTPLNGTGVDDYSWSFGDGQTSSLEAPTHSFDLPGEYLVTLTVRGNTDCTETYSIPIRISDDLDVDYTFDRPLCASDTTGFLFAQAVNGKAPYSYLWSTGDTTQAIENLVPGLYGLTITDADTTVLETGFDLFADRQTLANPRVEVNQGRSVCYGADIVVTAGLDHPNAVFRWFTTEDGIEPLFTGNQLQINAIESDQTWWVEAAIGPCRSSERSRLDIEVVVLDATFDANIRDGNTSTVFTFTPLDGTGVDDYSWSFGDGQTSSLEAPTHTFDLPGEYLVTLTVRGNTDCTETYSIPILVSDDLDVDFTFTRPVCAADTTGFLFAQAVSGRAPYTYLWSTGDTTQAIENLVPGEYGLTITDADTTVLETTFDLFADQQELAVPRVEVNQGRAVCAGEDIVVTAGSDIPGVTYIWYDSPTSNEPVFTGNQLQINNIEFDQTYYVEAAIGPCRSSERARLDIEVVYLNAAFVVNRIAGNRNTDFRFTPLYGRNVSSYRWDFGDGEISIEKEPRHTFSEEGEYWVELQVRGQTNCTDTYVVPIRVSDDLLASVAGDVVACETDATGELTAEVANGRPPFTYLWSTGAKTQTITGLEPGNYRVTVSDLNNNRAFAEGTVIARYPDGISRPVVSVNGGDPICPGQDVTILAQLPTDPEATFVWYEPGRNVVVGEGPLLLLEEVTQYRELEVVTKIGDCTSDRRLVKVNVPDVDLSLAIPGGTITTHDSLFLQLRGTTPVERIHWSFGDGMELANGPELVRYAYPVSGLYTIQVTCQLTNGCTVVIDRILRIVDPGSMQVSMQSVFPTCAGQANGMIVAQVSGGQSPYDFQWNTGEDGAIIQGLSAGTYAVTITDAQGLSNTGQVTLQNQMDELPAPDISTLSDGPYCAGDDLTLTAFSEASEADYYWIDGNNPGQVRFVGEQIVLPNQQGDVSFYVETRMGGCVSEERTYIELEVDQPVADFTISQEPALVGTEVSFQALLPSVTNSYFWEFGDGNQGSASQTSNTYSDPGTYQITLEVESESGCRSQRTRDLEVVTPSAFFATFAVTDNPCAEDEIGRIEASVFNGTAPYAFAWSSGQDQPVINQLGNGSYTVTITDARGEQIRETIVVSSRIPAMSNPEVISTAGEDGIICSGADVTLFGVSNQGSDVDFYWYDSPQAGSLLSGENAFELTNVQESVTLFVETGIDGCRSQERTEVSIDVEDANRGFRVDRRKVNVDQEVTFQPNQVTPGNTYNWYFGDGGVSSEESPVYAYGVAGTYDVQLIVQSASGCVEGVSETAFMEVVDDGQFSISLRVEEPSCPGISDGAIQPELLNGTGPFTYLWNNGATSPSLSDIGAGTFGLTVTDNDGNTASASVEVEPEHDIPQLPTISIIGDTLLCAGESVTLFAATNAPVLRYQWYNQSGELTAVGSSYTIAQPRDGQVVGLRTQNGACQSPLAERTLSVVTPNANFSSNPVRDVVLGEQVQFIPEVASYAAYEWSFGDGLASDQTMPVHTYQNLGNFDVSLRVTDGFGCSAVSQKNDAIRVLEENNIEITAVVDHLKCEGDQSAGIALDIAFGAEPYTISWADGAEGATRTGLVPGYYIYRVTDALGQLVVDSVELRLEEQAIAPPAVEVNGGLPVCSDDLFFLIGDSGSEEASFNWYNSEGDLLAADRDMYVSTGISESTTWLVESDEGGCTSAQIPIDISIQKPDADFRISPQSNIREGDVVQLRPLDERTTHTYRWEFGDGGWSTFRTPYYFYNKTGTYDVSLEVTDEDGCKNTLVKESFVNVIRLGAGEPIAGIPDEVVVFGATPSDLTGAAYPNPFRDNLWIRFESDQPRSVVLDLVDALGKVIVHQKIALDTGITAHRVQVNKEQLTPGIYFLQWRTGSQRKSISLIHIEP